MMMMKRTLVPQSKWTKMSTNQRDLEATAGKVESLLARRLGSYSRRRITNRPRQWIPLRITTRSRRAGGDQGAHLRMASCPSASELSLLVNRRLRLSARPTGVLRHLRSRCPRPGRQSPKKSLFLSHQRTNQQRSGNTPSERSSMGHQWILLFLQRRAARCLQSHGKRNMSSHPQSRSASLRGHHLPTILRNLLTRRRIWPNLPTTMLFSSLMR